MIPRARLGDVPLGSKADIASRPRYVRFAPESGHWLSALGCPLFAKSRLVVSVEGTNAGIDKLMRRGLLGVRICSFARQDVPTSCIRFLPQPHYGALGLAQEPKAGSRITTWGTPSEWPMHSSQQPSNPESNDSGRIWLSFDRVAKPLVEGCGSRDLRPAKWGSGVSLHRSNLEALMFRFGSEADMAAHFSDVRFTPKSRHSNSAA
jgi:hypothetical protein